MPRMDISTTALDVPSGELLANTPELRRVLDHLGITPECDGDESLKERFRRQNLDPGTMLRVLAAFDSISKESPVVTVELMTPGELCDHIERAHHRRLRQELSRLDLLIRTATEQHGADIMQLARIQEIFRSFRERITRHLREEAKVLFPLVRQLELNLARPAPRRWRTTSP